MAQDILFKTEEFIFSYRVAGILIRDEMVLLQRTPDDPGYAFPGGHVSFGETNEETLVREFEEEISASIKVNNLRWVGEAFFPWGKKSCQQIGLYYNIEMIDDSQIPLSGSFDVYDELDDTKIHLIFSWIPLSEIPNIKIYPANCVELLQDQSGNIRHFVYNEIENM